MMALLRFSQCKLQMSSLAALQSLWRRLKAGAHTRSMPRAVRRSCGTELTVSLMCPKLESAVVQWLQHLLRYAQSMHSGDDVVHILDS